MSFAFSDLITSFTGGIISIFSPCIIPIIPILFAGSHGKNKLRPIFVILGLALTFVIMGILTSVIGASLAKYMRMLEQISGIILIILGILSIININIFKNITFFNKFNVNEKETFFSSFIMGSSLGLVWIPCVGPVLSGILAMVASKADIISGVILLSVYTLGFSIPLLLTAYFPHISNKQIKLLKKYPSIIRILSAILLITLGVILLFKGMIFLYR